MKIHLQESSVRDFYKKVEELAKLDWNKKHYLYHVHFTDVLKLGTKLIHRHIFGPLGIYAFPIKFYVDDILTDSLDIFPFSHRKYAYILELDTNSRHIYFKDYISSEYITKVKKIAKSWDFDEKTLKKFERARKFGDLYKIIYEWFESNYLSYDKSVNLWKFLNKDLGLDVILDDGNYIISHDIEAQTVFMPPVFGYKVIDIYELGRTIEPSPKEVEMYNELANFSGNTTRILQILKTLFNENDIKLTYDDYQFIKKIFSLYKKIIVKTIKSGIIKEYFDVLSLRDAMMNSIIHVLNKKYPILKKYIQQTEDDVKKNIKKIKNRKARLIARNFFEKINENL